MYVRSYVLHKVEGKKQTVMLLLPATAPSASRMTRILLVALSVAGRRAKQPTGAPNASHDGGKNSN